MMTSQNTGYGNDLLLPELIPAWLHLQHDFLTVIRNHLLLRLGASEMARERGEEALRSGDERGHLCTNAFQREHWSSFGIKGEPPVGWALGDLHSNIADVPMAR